GGAAGLQRQGAGVVMAADRGRAAGEPPSRAQEVPPLRLLAARGRGGEMFERFTRAARLVVVQAQEEARQRKADEIRTEHLLAAFYAVPDADAPDDLAPAVLERFGVGRDEVLRAVDR